MDQILTTALKGLPPITLLMVAAIIYLAKELKAERAARDAERAVREQESRILVRDLLATQRELQETSSALSRRPARRESRHDE